MLLLGGVSKQIRTAVYPALHFRVMVIELLIFVVNSEHFSNLTKWSFSDEMQYDSIVCTLYNQTFVQCVLLNFSEEVQLQCVYCTTRQPFPLGEVKLTIRHGYGHGIKWDN